MEGMEQNRWLGHSNSACVSGTHRGRWCLYSFPQGSPRGKMQSACFSSLFLWPLFGAWALPSSCQFHCLAASQSHVLQGPQGTFWKCPG